MPTSERKPQRESNSFSAEEVHKKAAGQELPGADQEPLKEGRGFGEAESDPQAQPSGGPHGAATSAAVQNEAVDPNRQQFSTEQESSNVTLKEDKYAEALMDEWKECSRLMTWCAGQLLADMVFGLTLVGVLAVAAQKLQPVAREHPWGLLGGLIVMAIFIVAGTFQLLRVAKYWRLVYARALVIEAALMTYHGWHIHLALDTWEGMRSHKTTDSSTASETSSCHRCNNSDQGSANYPSWHELQDWCGGSVRQSLRRPGRKELVIFFYALIVLLLTGGIVWYVYQSQ